jgi:FlaA1/EpsC-like NDP-sugar epimerase
MGKGGEIFILDMGEPMKIVNLARDLIHLSGLRPDHDIEIRFTGIREGEKLFEELSLREEHTEKTRHPRIYIGRLKSQDWKEINRQLEELSELATCADPERIHAKFKEIVPEYQGWRNHQASVKQVPHSGFLVSAAQPAGVLVEGDG